MTPGNQPFSTQQNKYLWPAAGAAALLAGYMWYTKRKAEGKPIAPTDDKGRPITKMVSERYVAPNKATGSDLRGLPDELWL
ncbi:hypothetical protein HK098_002383 [Nowakowskiella sp. JEL0407]|nr:hypothetical protein HK098_002383 [Nowakowskiella sp. JEL0407]